MPLDDSALDAGTDNRHAFSGKAATGPLVPEAVLAKRWHKSVRTMQRWRAEGYGPVYMQIGGSIFYGESDIIEFENRMRRGGGTGK